MKGYIVKDYTEYQKKKKTGYSETSPNRPLQCVPAEKCRKSYIFKTNKYIHTYQPLLWEQQLFNNTICLKEKAILYLIAYIFKTLQNMKHFTTFTHLEYNIFFLTLAVSGHQDIRNSFCFLEDSDVPWHWCIYSKS